METPLRLRLAFQRVRAELDGQPSSGRALVANLFELELVEVDYKGWIDQLASDVREARYSPGPIEISPAPKPGGLVRPGSRLGLGDRVIYTAAVGACLTQIETATRWSQKTVDFGTWINPKKLSRQEWLLSPFAAWDAWRQRSLECLARSQTKFVVVADIAGYFENVSLPRLSSDLLRIDCSNEVVRLISSCLNHWAQTEGRGLPQGVLASDVLAKLYLESLDRSLKADGYQHVRYTDDIRIFCKNEREARRALVRLTELLRRRGLTLQSAKTKILPAEGLEEEFDGAFPVIRDLNRAYVSRARAAGLMAADPSMPISAIDDLIRRSPTKVPPSVIRQAFRRHIRDEKNPNKSVLHYVLRRMGNNGDDTALEYCTGLLFEHPEECGEVLRYFSSLGATLALQKRAVSALGSRELAMYPYQQHQILAWLYRDAASLSKPTLKLVRKLSDDGDVATYVRAVARALLGKFGDHADLDNLVAAFAAATDPLERAQLLCCLSRLERSRRNALLGRVRDEGPWVTRAVTLVRQGT